VNEHDLLEFALGIGGSMGAAIIGLMWSLNEKLAVIISRVDSHEKRLDHLENN
jgi:hypothetical protein